MKNRIFRIENPVTTILGVLILVFCGAMMWAEKAEADTLSGWFAFGISLLPAKDPKVAKKEE